jgi:hypothetical protein
MVRAVDLDELAEAAAAGAQLVDWRHALAPAQPKPGCGHPLAQRLADQADRMRLQADGVRPNRIPASTHHLE